MLLLNSVLTILVLEKVGAVKFDAKKEIMEAVGSSNSNTDKNIIFKISPDTLVDSFRAVVSSDYVRNLAEEFAQKAAAHFMRIIKGAEQKTFRHDKPRNNTEDNLIIPNTKESHIIKKEEVLVLMREPAIDGDNLEQALSDEISDTTEGITVRMKINGAYYKRNNMVVHPDLTSFEEPKRTKMMEVLKRTNTTTEKPKWTTQIPTK